MAGTDTMRTTTTFKRSVHRSLLTFLYLWLVVGFFLGTLVLIAPVRWLLIGVHRAGWSQSTANILVVALVIVYVVVSFQLARKLTGALFRARNRGARWTILTVPTIAALIALVAWRNPGALLARLAGGGDSPASLTTSGGAIFEFGAYPDEAKLRELQKRGVTTIISLQHPRVLVEREGITEETKATRKLGIRLVKAPMLPWFSHNRESLQTIRALALSGHGHYYVHCGLGRDRVNIAKKMIEGLGGTTVAAEGYKEGLGFEQRTVPLARGPIVRLAPGVFLIPYPDHEEMYGCILEGSPGRLVFILDPADPKQRAMLDEAKGILGTAAIRFEDIPVSTSQPASAATAADSVHRMTPPVTVIAPATPGTGENLIQNEGWQSAATFRDAYLGVAKAPAGPGGNSAGAAGGAVAYRPHAEVRGAQDKRSGC